MTYPCNSRPRWQFDAALALVLGLLLLALPAAGCRSGGASDKTQGKKGAKNGPPAYTADEISAFLEVAFGPEKGPAATLRRWDGPVRLSTSGRPLPFDLEVLGETVGELNQVIGKEKFILTGEDPNLYLRFIPKAEFAKHLTTPPAADPGVHDAFEGGPGGVITKGQILLDPSGNDGWHRRYIRSELARALGLVHRSPRDPQSLFAEPPGPAFGPLHQPDAKLIKMLFEPGLKAGMSRDQARAALTEARAPAPQ
jgi:hypothetical protein